MDKKSKLMFMAGLALVLLVSFALVVWNSAQAAQPADDDPPPATITLWWLGCRTNDIRYTNRVVTCFKPDGSMAWTRTIGEGWVRIRQFPYNGGEMTGVANLILAPAPPYP